MSQILKHRIKELNDEIEELNRIAVNLRDRYEAAAKDLAERHQLRKRFEAELVFKGDVAIGDELAAVPELEQELIARGWSRFIVDEWMNESAIIFLQVHVYENDDYLCFLKCGDTKSISGGFSPDLVLKMRRAWLDRANDRP
jgi:hypothetical protein